MRFFIYYISILFIFTSCKHQKTNSQSKLLNGITIEESACEGDCPAYTLTIYNNGAARFNGKLNVIKIGKHQYQFSKEDTKNLFDYISAIDILDFQDEYKSMIADLPTTVITFKEKQIVIKDLRTIPETLKILIVKLQVLARSTGYIN